MYDNFIEKIHKNFTKKIDWKSLPKFYKKLAPKSNTKQ